jgi:hypothetical protein
MEELSSIHAHKEDPLYRAFGASAFNSNPESQWNGHEVDFNYTKFKKNYTTDEEAYEALS